MAPESFKVSVPGSIMLFGEHAVLYGKQAIVAAINKRLVMELIPVTTDQITIYDGRLGTLELSMADLKVQAPFKHVLSAIMLFKDQLPSGFTLQIDSEISSTIGLGSSAAVTVATVAVLLEWLNGERNQQLIFDLSKRIILNLQGAGSGADLAASVYGGIICHPRKTEGFIGELDPRSAAGMTMPTITSVYSGYKTPTPEVIKIVQQAQQQEPEKFANIFDQMQACTTQAIDAIAQEDWKTLGALFKQHHSLQADLGTSTELLDSIANTLNIQPEIYGAKISGSGLGDCVIGLGDTTRTLFAANDNLIQFSLRVEPKGLIWL